MEVIKIFFEYLLRPNFFNEGCLQFYRRHYWLWCLRIGNIKCLLGFHKWIDCGRVGYYCDNCPMDKDSDGYTYLGDIGKC